jgi:radical SAM superfamily enzyme YgiQ (UPF0313 family)
MKVLLLFPAFGRNYAFQPPLGVAYLAAVLRRDKIPVIIIDAAKYTKQGNNVYKAFKKEITRLKPDILGLSAPSALSEQAYKASAVAKEVIPNITTIIGGPHATAVPEEVIKQPAIDIAIVGEGDFIISDLVRDIENKSSLKKIKGLYYKQNGKVVKTPSQDFCHDLDTLPFPARDMLPMQEYLKQRPLMPTPFPATTMMTSRGCPRNCLFCQPTGRRLFGVGNRKHSVKRVVDEMEFLVKTYKVKGIGFVDDEAANDKERTIALCREILRRKLRVKWYCSSRVDLADEEKFRWMKKSGCIQISFGVESGSQKILNYYRKGTKVEQIKRAFKLCRDIGIMARANLMIGAIEDTYETVQESINLVHEIRPDLISTAATTPVVGTDLFENVRKADLLKKKVLGDIDRFDISTMKRKYLSDNDVQILIQCVVKAYKQELLKSLFNPVMLYKRRVLILNILNYWWTLLQQPKAFAEALKYYLTYEKKERISENC